MPELKAQVARFLTSLYDAEQRRYQFASNRPGTLLSSCFALTTLALLNERWPHANPALERIASEQREDGTFFDPSFRPEDTRGSHSEDYISWQFCFFALAALDLHERKVRPLAFMEPYLDAQNLDRWLEARSWNRFWYASNEIMFMLYFLSYLWRRQGSETARTMALHVLDVLDARQDPATGFWGTDEKLTHRMYGAAHIYMAYDFFERPIRYADRIIDSTLGLQRDNGLYGQRFGGACEDYDGVEVLAKVSRATPHREAEVRRALTKTAETIRSRQEANGGFAYRLLPTTFRTYHRLVLALRGAQEYVYSGWNGMRVEVWQADTWGTLFRCLALLVIDDTLGEGTPPARFYDLPAWGYHRTRSASRLGAQQANR